MKKLLTAIVLSTLLGSAAHTAEQGLVADWRFNEGKGNVLRDASGNKNHGKIHGAKWVKSGKGHALLFDGSDDYVDCGTGKSLDLTDTVTLQAWVQPTAANRGEPGIAGKFFESYALTYYGHAYFYISGGGNGLGGPTKINAWTHLAGTFDGKMLRMYVNGLEVKAVNTKVEKIKHGNSFSIGCVFGDPNAADINLRNTSFFPGLIDSVRVHNRALGANEILMAYNVEAAEKGRKPFDPKLFGRVAIEPFFYPDTDTAVLAVNTRWVLPLPEGGKLFAELAPAGSEEPLQSRPLRPDAARYEDEAEFSLKGLKPGTYEMRALIRKPEMVIQAEKFTKSSKGVTVPTTGWLAGRIDLVGGWTEYKFRIRAGEYKLAVLAARIYDSAGIRCTIDGKQPVDASLNGPYGGGKPAWDNATWETVGSYKLAAGPHVLRIQSIPARDKKGKTHAKYTYIDAFALDSATSLAPAQKTERVEFRYPFDPPSSVPSPKARVVEPLPPRITPPAYGFKVEKGGGFSVTVKARKYRIESSYSYPRGGENRLVAGRPDKEGERSWKVRTRFVRGGAEVKARGRHYAITRLVIGEPTRIVVTDTIRNTSDDVLGIILSNHINTAGIKDVRVTMMSNPTIFAGASDSGVGLIALDDLYQLQQEISYSDDLARVETRHFGLDKGASYTVEWAVYPTATANYFDFINQVRKDEGINRLIEGPWSGMDWRNPIEGEKKLARLMGLAYINSGPYPRPEDDPGVSIEGYEFTEYPKYCAKTKDALTKTKEWFPHAKVMFHVAHSLYCTNKPKELFGDSLALDSKGKQLMYGPDSIDYYGRYMPKERFEAGWRWWLFYPTMENSFGKMMIERTRYMLDELGATGMWADGYISGYVKSRYTYDRWDGHSVDIDDKTKLVTRKKSCVPYAALPVLRKVIRMISEKGGVLLTNGHPGPRSLWKEDYLTSNETGGGDQRPIGGLHLGRSVTPLGNPTAIKNERDIYRDILTKLDLGALYWFYGGRRFITRKHLVQHMYPITTEAIHAGTVSGAERIVTRKSGVYGWHGDRSLHQVHLYDARGVLTRHNVVSTADADSVRTRLNLGEDQAAVVVKLPITLSAGSPLNVRVRRYDQDGIRILINGQGPVDLAIHTGDFPVQPGRTYAATGATDRKLKAGAEAVLSLRLDLRGPAEIVITREN